jgi:hypothetical protein
MLTPHILYSCYLIIHLHLIMLQTCHRSRLLIINSIVLIFDDGDDYRKDDNGILRTITKITNF